VYGHAKYGWAKYIWDVRYKRRDIGMDEWKGMIQRNVRDGGEAWISGVSLPAKTTAKKEKSKN
jgi:hypothetical protein